MDSDTINTRTEEIPRKHWPLFFDEFSRRHEGWLVDVEVLMGERGAQKEVSALPFYGATAVLDAPASVTIELGGREADHVEHRIDAPDRVWLESLADGAEAALDIESEGGRKTLLKFRSPQPAEAVDGIASPRPRRSSPPKRR